MHPNGHKPAPASSDPTDNMSRVDGNPTDGTWMTKAELAAVRRISIASADRLIRCQGWRKHPGNDGRARVLVPSDWAMSRGSDPTDDPRHNPTDKPPARAADHADDPTDSVAGPTDITRAVSALEAAVAGLREQLGRAEGRADRAEATAVTERERADALRTQLEAAREEARAATAQIAQAEAEADAAELRQADDARKARGRLRRAWDGWRGR
jgi:hypothetical protein